MKQVILNILIFFALAPSLFAQGIAVDEGDLNGRFITTEFLPFYMQKNGSAGSLSLGVAYNTSMQTLFCLNLKLEDESNIRINKGSSLQLITNEGEIVVLHNTSDITTTGNSTIVSYGVQYNERELADLDMIMNERIVKIKIETEKGILEKEVTGNLFSKSVYSCFIVLKNYLEKQKDE